MINAADRDTTLYLYNAIKIAKLKELYELNVDTAYRIIIKDFQELTEVANLHIHNNTCTVQTMHIIDEGNNSRIACEEEKVLTNTEFDKIRSQLNAINFWANEGIEEPKGCYPSYYIIKGYSKKGNKAHAIMINRHSNPNWNTLLRTVLSSTPKYIKCREDIYLRYALYSK